MGPISIVAAVVELAEWSVVRSSFVAVAETEVRALVERGWGIELRDLVEVLEGAGAYHWEGVATHGRRWFVTCDDLSTKPWLGADNDTVFEHLLIAYRTAHTLRSRGMSSVLAPLPARTGEPARRLDDRHSIAVCEHVDGDAGRWGQPLAADELSLLVDVLAELHRSALTTPPMAHRHLEVAGRGAFDAALAATDRPWDAGPLSEPARRTLRAHLEVVRAWLAELTRIAERTGPTRRRVVLTHGEPHPGNLILTTTGPRLIDWDTVAPAPPERDLWMIAGADRGAAARYTHLTGTVLDEELLRAYALLWAVTDVAAFTSQLRRPHRGDSDDQQALHQLGAMLDDPDPRPFGPAHAARPDLSVGTDRSAAPSRADGRSR